MLTNITVKHNNPGSPHRPPVRGLLETFRAELRIRNYSRATIKTYTGVLRAFLRFFYPQHPRDITPEAIRRYLFYLVEERHLSFAVVNQTLNALRFLYKELYQRPWIVEAVPRPRGEYRLPYVLNQNEVLAVIQCVHTLKHRLLLQFLYGSGLRVSEVVKLRVRDIDLEKRTVFVRGGKGHKDRLTILPESLREPLKRYVKGWSAGTYLFPGSGGRQTLTTRTVQKVFQQALLASGIKKKASCHTLRHSFATHLLEAGVDIRYIQQLLGHSRLETTSLYTRVQSTNLFRIRSPLDQVAAREGSSTKSSS